jgi:hypothetical protein
MNLVAADYEPEWLHDLNASLVNLIASANFP